MKRWWSWALYVFSVYATSHLAYVNYQFSKMSSDKEGRLAAAIASQLFYGVPASFLFMLPFIAGAFACVALVSISRLSGGRFDRVSLLAAWSIASVGFISLLAPILSEESFKAEKAKAVALEIQQKRVDYLNEIRSAVPAGTKENDAYAVIQQSGRAEFTGQSSKISYDKETGLPATKWSVEVYDAGVFDLYVDDITKNVIRSEIIRVFD